MKIDFISDIHLDFYIKSPSQSALKQFINQELKILDRKANVLIVPGDIGHYNHDNIALLKYLRNFYEYILVTSGNHDLYLVSNAQRNKYKTSMNRLNEFIELCNSEDKIIFMNGQDIKIDDKVIYGQPFWYDISADYFYWKQIMNDSKLIISFNPYEFYNDEIKKFNESINSSADLVFTHVSMVYPSVSDGLPERYRYERSNIFYFTSNDDLLIKKACNTYIHGHSHNKYDYKRYEFNVYCNPLGYKHELLYNQIKQIQI